MALFSGQPDPHITKEPVVIAIRLYLLKNNSLKIRQYFGSLRLNRKHWSVVANSNKINMETHIKWTLVWYLESDYTHHGKTLNVTIKFEMYQNLTLHYFFNVKKPSVRNGCKNQLNTLNHIYEGAPRKLSLRPES